MVLFSSVAALTGNIGQADYAAANCYLDSFAQWRYAQGLPTLSINWGLWAETGMGQHLQESAQQRGLAALTTPTALTHLELVMTLNKAQVVIAKFAQDEKPQLQNQDNLNQQHHNTAVEIEEFIVEILSENLEIPLHRIDVQQPFLEMGIDSVTALKLVAILEDQTQTFLPKTLFFDYANIKDLSQGLVKQYSNLLNFKQSIPQPTANVQISKAVENTASKSQIETNWAHSTFNSEPIAVIGMSGRFPDASDVQSFWELLRQGHDAVTEVPAERWDVNKYYNPNPQAEGTSYSKWGAFLKNLEQFDPLLFRISPREAETMDPQQRIMLELVWETLEIAGYGGKKLADTETGVFIGATYSHYSRENVPYLHGDAYASLGNSNAILANRLSYFFGWRGPSLTIDTLCSSSLVALHMGVQSLRRGECEQAIVGGVHAGMSLGYYQALSRLGAVSPKGRCRTFDRQADGYVPGEGAGVFILKPLSKALRDRDFIWGLILGSATNHSGRSSGLTVPNSSAQARLIQRALKDANVSADDISYIEAHGTATSLGDPIEVQGLVQAFSSDTQRQQFCAIGSVKSNIGHLEPAAGMAGLFKILLAMKAKQIPPTLHVTEINPNINFEQTPFYVNDRLRDWKADESPRRAGLSAFGMGGANVHVVVQEAPEVSAIENSCDRPIHILTLSAKNETALQQLTDKFSQHLANHPSQKLADICFSANTGRAHLPHRLSVIASSQHDLANTLHTYHQGQTASNLHTGQIESRPKICFLFTGQGSQYAEMGKQLYLTQPSFRKVVDRCAAILEGELEQPLLEVLFGQQQQLLQQTSYTQVGLFVIEYALYELWQSWGVKPDVVMGHSLGEYVAATVASVMSLEEGLRLVAYRGKLMQALPSNGAMAAVFASVEQVLFYTGQIDIAALNGPQNTVISGSQEAITKACSQLQAAGISVHPLAVSQGFHSVLMKPMLEQFAIKAGTVNWQAPKIQLLSNLNGEPITQVMDAQYWCEQILRPVQFAKGMEYLQTQQYQVFLEIGAHPILCGMASKLPQKQNLQLLPSIRREDKSCWQTLLSSAGKLYTQGVDINWEQFDADFQRCRVPLPTYPFQRQHYWLKPSNQNDQPTTIKPMHTFLDRQVIL
jgi:acyl transferase domain-containing protein/acyl carrier protein